MMNEKKSSQLKDEESEDLMRCLLPEWTGSEWNG